MKGFIAALRWDLFRQTKYNIVGVTIAVTLLYLAVLYYVPLEGRNLDLLLILLIFNDPAALSVLFVGALVLFERTDRTFFALAVSPLTPAAYLWSKSLSLGLLATLASAGMAIVGHGWDLHWGWFILGLLLSSILFCLLGFVVVAYCQSFNQYILRVALVLIPIGLPLLNLFGMTDTYWWYLLPSQATLILLEASLTTLPLGALLYAVGYLVLWIVLAYWFALRAYSDVIAKA